MGRPSPDYTPKSPAQGVLYQVVRDHFETFRAEAARVYERDALPRFIEEEFRYYGVLGARAAWGSRLQARDPEPPVTAEQCRTDVTSSSRPAASVPPRANRIWAELMQRSFGFDVLACPRCVDRLELVALIEDPKVIRRILRHLGLPTEGPAARSARPPPLPVGRSETWYDTDDVTAP